MNSIPEYLTSFIVVLMMISLGSCAAAAPNRQEAATPSPAVRPLAPATSDRTAEIPTRQSDRPSQLPANTVTLNSNPNLLISQQPQEPKSDRPSQLPPKTVTVNIYYIDSQCEKLIPMPVTVPAEESLEAAVARVLEWQDTRDFNFSYRVILDRDRHLATIDLRVSPNSRRQITSLSTCEQIALFSALEKTLTSNPIWNVREVRFTEMGEEIWL